MAVILLSVTLIVWGAPGSVTLRREGVYASMFARGGWRVNAMQAFIGLLNDPTTCRQAMSGGRD
ncbi:hypothetical protein CNQ84_03150 [Pseudomonas abyssi]|uniref:Uncharacterized protein n=1 Tax=Pseudomonas abyssi TaxID=170540 RepID=A0A2A3ML39_9PSED|nr:hypothetical protein CNQ84_03150 [Pseudomonas abyssi]